MPQVTWHAGFKHALRCVPVSDAESMIARMEEEGWTFQAWEPAAIKVESGIDCMPVMLSFAKRIDTVMIDAKPIMERLEQSIAPIANLASLTLRPLDRDEEQLVACGRLKAYEEALEILHRAAGI